MIAWILDIAHHNILEKCFGNWVCSAPWVNWVGFSPPIWMMTERTLFSETVFLKQKMMSEIHILSNPKYKPVCILNYFAATKIENRQVFLSWYVVKHRRILEVCHPRCVCETRKWYVVKHNYVTEMYLMTIWWNNYMFWPVLAIFRLSRGT